MTAADPGRTRRSLTLAVVGVAQVSAEGDPGSRVAATEVARTA
jgi:hypothetical protein